MKNQKINIPDRIKVWCTDRDTEVEVDFISQQGGTIRCAFETIPLMFNRIKPGVYVANFSGMEFVMKL